MRFRPPASARDIPRSTSPARRSESSAAAHSWMSRFSRATGWRFTGRLSPTQTRPDAGAPQELGASRLLAPLAHRLARARGILRALGVADEITLSVAISAHDPLSAPEGFKRLPRAFAIRLLRLGVLALPVGLGCCFLGFLQTAAECKILLGGRERSLYRVLRAARACRPRG